MDALGIGKKAGAMGWKGCLAAVSLAVAIAQLSGSAAAEDAGDEIAIGMNTALSGPASAWGLPGLTGLNIVIDRINSAGGVDVGGKKHKLKLYTFDNEFIPSKALQGARQLVFEHQVKLVLDIGSTTADSQHPFLTDQKVFYGSLVASDINSERPYLFAGSDVNPRGEMSRVIYQRMMYPDKNRYAIFSQDDTTGMVTQSWEVAAAKVLGFDMVYDKHFSQETTDFAPLVTSVLATNPDFISLNVTWPDYIVPIVELLYQHGFNGVLSGNYFVEAELSSKVPAEWLEKVRTIDSYPNFDDPWFGNPSPQHEFSQTWVERYGPGAPDDQKRTMNGIDWLYAPLLEFYVAAVERAGSLDADEVLEAMHKIDTVDTVQGSVRIAGESMWGYNNMISPLVPTNEFRASCKCKRVQMEIDFLGWYAQHKDALNAVVRERGQMWDQRH